MTRQLTADERTIAVFAFRYALGRMTYAPSLVAGYITEHLDSFTEQDRKQMVDEIEDAERDRLLGDACDAEVWLELKDRLMKREGGV